MDTSVLQAPLLALSLEAQSMLSALLNPLKIIPTETNLPRDWRGVAELSNVPAEKMALFEGKPDPFKEILGFLAGLDGIKITVDDLKAFLGIVDRFDVLEDVEPILDRDVASYRSRVSGMNLVRNVETLCSPQDSSILTFEDAVRAQKKLPLCRYDAFIIYSDDDSEFASEIITRMETEYDLKLCSKDRDLLPGLRFEHEVIGQMIEARCNRLLVIFSPSFLNSNANQFLVSYAQAVALETRSRKIIPCVYKKCELPPSVRYSFCIDYTRSSGKLWNFWEKLSQSLAVASSANSMTSESTTNTKASNVREINSSCKLVSTVPKDIDDMEWWDANKPEKALANDTTATGSLSQVHSKENCEAKTLDDRYDAMSVNSQAQLLPSTSSSSSETKSSKWLSKIMSPISRKKRSEKDKSKQKPIAE